MSIDIQPTPLHYSYWILPGRLLAGEYPGNYSVSIARERIASMLDAGFDRYINLTTVRDKLEPYAGVLEELSGGRACHLSLAVPDMSVPDGTGTMTAILDAIDDGLDSGHKVYVHCWGGVGRTGTVIGCWLKRHYPATDGRIPQADETLLGLDGLWQTCPKSVIYPESPQTPEQRAFVAGWQLGMRS